VFASPVGTWMSKSNFYRDAWKPTRAAAGREDLTFHDLRHTAASLLLAHSGAELAELSSSSGTARSRTPSTCTATWSPAGWKGSGRRSTPRSAPRRRHRSSRPPRRGSSPGGPGCGW
jgi:hypothetical protein